jgi:hypothetical protein
LAQDQAKTYLRDPEVLEEECFQGKLVLFDYQYDVPHERRGHLLDPELYTSEAFGMSMREPGFCSRAISKVLGREPAYTMNVEVFPARALPDQANPDDI